MTSDSFIYVKLNLTNRDDEVPLYVKQAVGQ